MKLARTIITTAALALLAATAVQAQKTDKTAGQTSGEMSPQQKADEGVVKAAKPAPSGVDRKALQQEAAAARKAGTTVDGECSVEQKADAGACKKPAVKTTTARADVKKDAAVANKGGSTKLGEMSPPQARDEGAIKR